MNDAFAIFGLLDPPLWLVTAAAGSRRGGLIATFVNQASIVPARPRVVVGIAKQHHTWELIETSGALVLHLLDEKHLDWVWQFALQSGREVDKLAGLEVVTTVTGSPRLRGVIGWLECRVAKRLDTGDRTIYLAEVVESALEKAAPPLTWQRLLALAPPEKLRQLKRLLERDAAIDAAAMG